MRPLVLGLCLLAAGCAGGYSDPLVSTAIPPPPVSAGGTLSTAPVPANSLPPGWATGPH